MNRQRNLEKENMRLTFCLWVALCAGAMFVMLIFAANKTIVIADMSPEQSVSGGNALNGEGIVQIKPLSIDETAEESGSFCIPLPKGIKAENVVIENRYMDEELWLYLQCEDTDFFEENALTGDTSFIREGSYEIQRGRLLLKLKMQQVLEYRSTLENDMLVIACCEPWEMYDYIVVLDPAGGGGRTGLAGDELQEKDVAFSVAKLVQKKLAMSNVRVYLTRTEDVDLPEERRLALLDAVKADIYIGVGAAKSEEEPDSYGILCYYNEEYFIPDFGNIQLADILTREVTIASSNRAAGLVPAESDSLLKQITIPAVKLSVGYLSNPKEQVLLGQESYQEKLAEGILTALKKVCQELEELEKERR